MRPRALPALLLVGMCVASSMASASWQPAGTGSAEWIVRPGPDPDIEPE